MISRLVAWLRRLLKKFRRNRRRWRGDAIEFPTFDVGQVSEELDIATLAAATGEHDLPPSDSVELDGPQQTIVAKMQADIWEIRAAANVTYAGLTNRIDEIELKNYRRPSLDERFRKRLSTLEHEVGTAFQAARDRYMGVKTDFDAFKAARHIERQPADPDSRMWQSSLLLVALVAEGVMNAVFFERGSDRGFVGGATFALLLAFVDVLLVYSLGIRAAWLASRRTWERVVGGVTTAVFTAWVVGYNLLVAHIREHLQSGAEIGTAAEAALDAFRSDPMGLTQADSWILFVVGVVFSTLAFISALRWDDPIRGYGALHRRVSFLKEDVEFHAMELFRRASELRDETLEELDACLRKARSDRIALANATETKATMVRNFLGFTRHCHDTLLALLQTYRTENLKHRSTPAPAYFNERVAEILVEPLEDTEGRDRTKLSEQTAVLTDIETDAERIRDNVDELFNEFLARARDLTGQSQEFHPPEDRRADGSE